MRSEEVYHPRNVYPLLVGTAGTVAEAPLRTLWELTEDPPSVSNETVTFPFSVTPSTVIVVSWRMTKEYTRHSSVL